MPVDLELWNKLRDFALDDANAQVNFTGRLAHENGWPDAFAKDAVGEYKKFVYLAAISETPVTPSDIVDQVWHLHLTFTRSYWDDMCATILGHPLHHGPTKGGAREDAKYRKQYAETLALYRDEFGEEPPLAFWPPEDARFAGAQHQRWVDTRTHVVFRKPKLRALWAGTALAASGSTAAIAAEASSDTGSATAYLVGGGIAAAALLLLGAISGGRRNDKKRGRHNGGGDGSFVVTSGGVSGGGKGSKGDGGEGGEGGEGGGEGGGDGGGGCGGGGCSS